MNKARVDELIPKAYTVLADVGIAQNGEVISSWRGQISSFGASIVQGSVLAAVAFFSEQAQADVDRSKLMDAIAKLIGYTGELFDYVNNSEDTRKAKEEIVNAAIALKLAMNLYVLVKKKRG